MVVTRAGPPHYTAAARTNQPSLPSYQPHYCRRLCCSRVAHLNILPVVMSYYAECQGRSTDRGKGALCSGVHQEGKRNHTTASCRRQAGSTGSERQIGA
ncbi:hypothetical protein Pcinc_041866 [Petrolisthes cinctipes]|uniref:Uncharacterized protein n=1 Tax=Petrolisthes cinctipes TaxID=88211 RepID=A0AAE1BIS0_PETCI|nr:hypothetical protein Pcinc_041866 [Petrolisthes cinctipes]